MKHPELTKRLKDQVKNGTHLSQDFKRMKELGVWKHGLSHNKSYSTWRGMMNRCYRKQDICYKNYGGRGIKVCKQWKNVITFHKWFIDNYIDGMTLNRINNNGNYEPRNCNFVSASEQSRNKRTTKYSLEIARLIRVMHTVCPNQHEIARRTGMDFRYINLIIKNKRWAEIEIRPLLTAIKL